MNSSSRSELSSWMLRSSSFDCWGRVELKNELFQAGSQPFPSALTNDPFLVCIERLPAAKGTRCRCEQSRQRSHSAPQPRSTSAARSGQQENEITAFGAVGFVTVKLPGLSNRVLLSEGAAANSKDLQGGFRALGATPASVPGQEGSIPPVWIPLQASGRWGKGEFVLVVPLLHQQQRHGLAPPKALKA